MTFPQRHSLSRRHFCLCCIAGASFAATNGWLTPREAFAEARGLVSEGFRDLVSLCDRQIDEAAAAHGVPNPRTVLADGIGDATVPEARAILASP